MESRKTLDAFSIEVEVLDEILVWWRENGGEAEQDKAKLELATDTLLFRLNAKRESVKDPRRGLTPHRLGRVLRDIGFRKGGVADPDATWVKATTGPEKDKWVLRPTPVLIEELAKVAQLAKSNGQDGPAASPDSPDSPLTLWGDGDVDPRTFHRILPQDRRVDRCPRCGNVKDLAYVDPNGKRFCTGCFEGMTGSGL